MSLQPTLGAEAHPELVEAYHDGVLELVAAAGGRLQALAAGEAREGFAGASLPALALLEEPAPALQKLLEELERLDQFLFVHPGPVSAADGRPDWWGAVVDYPGQMQAAYASWSTRLGPAHPRLRVVFAILAGGAPFQLERLRSRWPDAPERLPDTIFLDTASYGQRALELCLAAFGADQLVYGSDVPVIDSRPTLNALEGLGEGVSQMVRSKNPTRLLRP